MTAWFIEGVPVAPSAILKYQEINIILYPRYTQGCHPSCFCQDVPYSGPSPTSHHNRGQDASSPIFQCYRPCWLQVIQYSLEWKYIFCTFVGVNFLAESVSETRNLHLKFQHFSGVTPPDQTPTTGGKPPAPNASTAILAMCGGKRPRCWDTGCDAVGASRFLTAWGENPGYILPHNVHNLAAGPNKSWSNQKRNPFACCYSISFLEQ